MYELCAIENYFSLVLETLVGELVITNYMYSRLIYWHLYYKENCILAATVSYFWHYRVFLPHFY